MNQVAAYFEQFQGENTVEIDVTTLKNFAPGKQGIPVAMDWLVSRHGETQEHVNDLIERGFINKWGYGGVTFVGITHDGLEFLKEHVS